VASLAIDGKGGKAELLERVARWVAASGRNVTQPGESAVRHLGSPTDCPLSNDRLVRDIEDSDSTFGKLQDWPSPLRRGTSLEKFRYMNPHPFVPCLHKASTHLESLTFQALNSLDVKRRVILSGTPIQVTVCQVMHILLLNLKQFLLE
jgi:DNA repair and recombination RAD54-like protein